MFVVMRLHNFSVDSGEITWFLPPSAIMHKRAARYDADSDATLTAWWTASTQLGRDFRQNYGRRFYLELRTLLYILTDVLKHRGVTRPALS